MSFRKIFDLTAGVHFYFFSGVETHLSLQAVCDTPIARTTDCVSSFIQDIGRRLPFELQQCSSYQGQQVCMMVRWARWVRCTSLLFSGVGS